jgi:hypothetical protein
MSMAQIHLKSKDQYQHNDDDVVYFSVPFWGLLHLWNLAISFWLLPWYHIVYRQDASIAKWQNNGIIDVS